MTNEEDAKIAFLEGALDRLTEERDELLAALERIANWCSAYPVETFSQERADATLALMKRHGLDPSALHASWARHLLEGIGGDARAAVAKAGGHE